MGKKQGHVYRFLDSAGEIIYVGKTRDMKQRMSQHFGGNGHLPQAAYDAVEAIEYISLPSYADAGLLELWMIGKYMPLFNDQHANDGVITIHLDYSPFVWKEWDEDRYLARVELEESIGAYTAKVGSNLKDSTSKMYANSIQMFVHEVLTRATWEGFSFEILYKLYLTWHATECISLPTFDVIEFCQKMATYVKRHSELGWDVATGLSGFCFADREEPLLAEYDFGYSGVYIDSSDIDDYGYYHGPYTELTSSGICRRENWQLFA